MQRTVIASTLVSLAAVTAGCGGGGSPAAKVPDSKQSTPAVTSTKPVGTVVAGPPLSGRYKVVVVVTTSNTAHQAAGTKVTRTWTFTPLCAEATCGATLAREIGWSTPTGGATTKTFTSTAKRTATGYEGVERRPQQCTASPGRVVTGPEEATLIYRIYVTAKNGARPTFEGSATNTAPAQGGCRAVGQSFRFTGTPA